jgi:MFS family permease
MEKALGSICYKWIAISVVSVGTLLCTLDSGSMRIALPQLGHVFQAGPNAVVWVLLIYQLVSTGFMLILGRVGDVFGESGYIVLG